jgi:hypothetical protein
MKTRTRLIIFLIVAGGVFYFLLTSSLESWGRTRTYEVEKTYRPEIVRPDDIRAYRLVLNTPVEETKFHDVQATDTVIRLATPGDKVDLVYRAIPFLGVETYTFEWKKGQYDDSWGEGALIFWIVLIGSCLVSGVAVTMVAVIIAALAGYRRDI